MLENKNQYLFKFHTRPQLIIFIHILIALAGLIFLCLIFSIEDSIFLYLWLGTIFMHFSLLFLSTYFGWNAVIYFDNEKAWQKTRKKQYEWRWEDVSSCKLRIYPARAPYIIIAITTNLNYKKLKFEYDRRREKILMEKCPNERVVKLLKKAFED